MAGDLQVTPTRGVTVRTLFLAGVAVLGVVALALLTWRLLSEFLLILTAIILTEGLRPAVDALNRRGVPFGLSIAAVYAALLVAVLGLVALLTGPVVRELSLLTSYEPVITNNVSQLLGRFQVSGQQLAGLATSLLAAAGGLTDSLLKIGTGMVGLVGDILKILLLSITWMAASRSLKGFTVGLFPAQRREFVEKLIAETGRAFAGYVRGVGINMIAIGVLAMLACWLLRLPAPVLLGVFAGLCELIPLLGPFLGAVPAVLLGFTVGLWFPLVVAGAFLALQQLESNVLVPVVMRYEVGLRPFAVLVALLVGAGLGGIWGALVAVPVYSAIQIIVVRLVAPAVRARQAEAAGEDRSSATAGIAAAASVPPRVGVGPTRR